AARGEILLFLDDDMLAHSRLLAEHDRSHADGADAVLGHIPLYPTLDGNFLTTEYEIFAEDRASRLSRPGSGLSLQDLLTGQLSVKREILEKFGGFDVRFTRDGTYGDEDLDFGIRLLQAGSRVVFNVYALTFHHYAIVPRDYIRQARQTGRADVL